LAQTPEGLIALDMAAEEFELRDMTDSLLEQDLLPRPIGPRPGGKEVLLVDPNPGIVRAAEDLLRVLARVHVCVDFSAARDRLISHPPQLLVANIRLREYNALHLVLRARPKTRCIVYSAYDDVGLAREAQAAGAFYERQLVLAPALIGYLSAVLPPRDRRDVEVPDRRQFPRGGRRAYDL
jgi:PleD family two-component response regulator